MKALVTLERLRLLRGRGVWLAATIALIVAAFGVLARHASGQTRALELSFDLGFAHLLVYFLPYLFAAGMISEDISKRTLPFLTSCPIPRGQVMLAKWLVASAASCVILLAACLVLHVGSHAIEPGELVATLPGTLAIALMLLWQSAAYGAIAAFYGAAIPSAASAMFALHLLFVEAGLSLAPGPLRLLSLAHHGAELAGLPRHGLLSESVPSLPDWAHLGFFVAVPAVALLAACLIFSRREYGQAEGD